MTSPVNFEDAHQPRALTASGRVFWRIREGQLVALGYALGKEPARGTGIKPERSVSKSWL